MAALLQEHRRGQRCWMLHRGDALPQLPTVPGSTQDHIWQGMGPGLALLAGCFTECSSLHPKCSPEHLSGMMEVVRMSFNPEGRGKSYSNVTTGKT